MKDCGGEFAANCDGGTVTGEAIEEGAGAVGDVEVVGDAIVLRLRAEAKHDHGQLSGPDVVGEDRQRRLEPGGALVHLHSVGHDDHEVAGLCPELLSLLAGPAARGGRAPVGEDPPGGAGVDHVPGIAAVGFRRVGELFADPGHEHGLGGGLCGCAVHPRQS